METRARYVLIGLFTLAVIAAGFGFVYWLYNTGGLGERTAYRIRFETPASGLRAGSAVLFNGIRVGEVTELRLDPQQPRHVMATVVIDRKTPVRTDTRVGVSYQGLMGAAAVSLTGGSAASLAPVAARGEPAILVADPSSTQDLTQAARGVLRHIDAVVVDNAEPLKSTITNLSTFSGTLARNSDRLDRIIEGLERMTSGTPTKPPTPVYSLAAPRTFPALEKEPRGQIVVLEPTTLVAFDTQKILIQGQTGEILGLDNAQWSDSLPKLFQAKIIQSFENANYLRTVSRPMDGLAADHQISIDIRGFQVATFPEPAANIEFAARILADNGRIVDARTFHATVPVKEVTAAAAAAGLNEAFGRAITELVLWTSGVI